MKNYNLGRLFVLVCLIVLPTVSKAAIDEKMLKQAKLELAWQNAISLNAKEQVQRINVLGDNLYILTNANYLFCLDRNTGKLVFGIAVAEAGLPVSEPTVYKNTAYIVAANKLIAMDLQQGAELYSKKIPFLVSSPAAVNASYFYFAGKDNLMHASDTNSLREIFVASPSSKSDITSVMATDDKVFFATQGGNLLCMAASGPKKIWQYDAVGTITAGLVKNGDWIYASGKDTNLYKLNAENGDLAWKFRSGAILTQSARATEKVVYQYAPLKGLFAVDANSGKQMWLLPEAVDLLAQDSNSNTAYIIGRNKICTVMDNKLAKEIYTINFASITKFGVNTSDSKIYIMEGKNISCIRPIKK
ncbi:MAG: PQQ-binding-like beta-propeller repeat protein [Sedimentisphaerales bacterium]